MTGAAARYDVDLSSACAAHIGCVTAGFYLELHDRIWRRTEVLRVECRIGIGRAVEQEEVCVRTIAPDYNR